MAEKNSLYFKDIEVEEDIRALLKKRFKENDVYALFKNGVNIVPIDSDLKSKVRLPAVTVSVFQQRAISPDNQEFQRVTPFTVEINTYVSGDEKVTKNRKLTNIIIQILQATGMMAHYYSKGLFLEENTEMNSMLESAYRRVIRMSAICDNSLKLIRQGE